MCKIAFAHLTRACIKRNKQHFSFCNLYFPFLFHKKHQISNNKCRQNDLDFSIPAYIEDEISLDHVIQCEWELICSWSSYRVLVLSSPFPPQAQKQLLQEPGYCRELPACCATVLSLFTSQSWLSPLHLSDIITIRN